MYFRPRFFFIRICYHIESFVWRKSLSLLFDHRIIILFIYTYRCQRNSCDVNIFVKSPYNQMCVICNVLYISMSWDLICFNGISRKCVIFHCVFNDEQIKKFCQNLKPHHFIIREQKWALRHYSLNYFIIEWRKNFMTSNLYFLFLLDI